MENAKLNKIATALINSLDLANDSFEKSEFLSKSEFQHLVSELVKKMIETDFERFLSAMYRMDVSEQKLKAALNTPNADDVYSKIADLIIAREYEKLKWKEKYKN